MNLILFVILFLGFYFFLKKQIQKRGKEEPADIDLEYKTEEQTIEEDFDETEDFEKEYFEGVKNGEPYQLFLILGGLQDCSLIRSLLAADDIPTFVENENANKLYGGVPSTITGIFSIRLFILVKDYEKAYEIVCNYVNSKKEQIKNAAAGEETFAEKAASVALGLSFAPWPAAENQKTLGITVLPKAEK
ncbi:MAG: DUF2007 domain-containing protein [Treponemataceae bacterium]|nr:DUF2007 domain-containing protein [Treponemataceae bacterium]